MNINIGELIKEEMDRQGITATQLAKKIGCERPNVYNIVKRNSINTEQLMRICRALGVNYFSLLANEVWKEGLPNPKRVLRESILSFRQDGDEQEYNVQAEQLVEAQQDNHVLDIGLEINGVNFDETLEMPEEFFEVLNYVYCCALDDQEDYLDDEDIDCKFFPWLRRHHPRLAGEIEQAVEDLLTERLADDVEGTYRDVINYEEPSDEYDWYELGDNDIKYFVGNLTERIRIV
jgi:transcriptional regulator with XRE-family HTH domain